MPGACLAGAGVEGQASKPQKRISADDEEGAVRSERASRSAANQVGHLLPIMLVVTVARGRLGS